MNTFKSTIHIPQKDQGQYIQVPFHIPENVARIDITYTYPRETHGENSRNTIDFALIHHSATGVEKSHIGAAGSNRSSFWLSAHDASDGFTPMELTPGDYAIVLGAYEVSPQGVDVACHVAFTYKQRQLLKGDLHAHTTASDGRLEVTALVQYAKQSGLDFMAITDHNNEPLFMPPSDHQLTLIPGIEWTPLYNGHANFIGTRGALKRPYHQVTTKAQVQEIFAQAREAGALVSLNHPLCTNCPWLWGFDIDSDLFEIWNGPPQPANIEALKTWHGLLCAGKRPTAIGGSDFHRHSPLGSIGSPTTWVYSQSRSPGDILSALKKGHAFVTFSTEGPLVDITCGDAVMGDTVPFEASKPIHFHFKDLRQGDIVQIYHNTGEATATVFQAGELTLDIPMKPHMFYRAQVVRTLAPGIPPMPVLISNPIYVSNNQ